MSPPRRNCTRPRCWSTATMRDAAGRWVCAADCRGNTGGLTFAAPTLHAIAPEPATERDWQNAESPRNRILLALADGCLRRDLPTRLGIRSCTVSGVYTVAQRHELIDADGGLTAAGRARVEDLTRRNVKGPKVATVPNNLRADSRQNRVLRCMVDGLRVEDIAGALDLRRPVVVELIGTLRRAGRVDGQGRVTEAGRAVDAECRRLLARGGK